MILKNQKKKSLRDGLYMASCSISKLKYKCFNSHSHFYHDCHVALCYNYTEPKGVTATWKHLELGKAGKRKCRKGWRNLQAITYITKNYNKNTHTHISLSAASFCTANISKAVNLASPFEPCSHFKIVDYYPRKKRSEKLWSKYWDLNYQRIC